MISSKKKGIRQKGKMGWWHEQRQMLLTNFLLILLLFSFELDVYEQLQKITVKLELK